MTYFAQHQPCLELKNRDVTLCEVCARLAFVPYRVCRGCSNVPSWHHGRCCPGDPKVQVNAPKPTDSDDERALALTYHQDTIPDLVIYHQISVCISTGTIVPLLEQDELWVVRYGIAEIIRRAIQHELKHLPERADQHHVAPIREHMVRYANARYRPATRNKNNISFFLYYL